MTFIASPSTAAHSYAEFRLGLLADAPALRVVRKLTEAALHSWDLPDLVDDTLIVVNELSTNATTAAPGDWIELTLRRLSEGVLVEVWDGSSELPADTGSDDLDLIDPDAENGRGMLVIAAYSAKHGITQTPGRQGKTIWALCTHEAIEP